MSRGKGREGCLVRRDREEQQSSSSSSPLGYCGAVEMRVTTKGGDDLLYYLVQHAMLQ